MVLMLALSDDNRTQKCLLIAKSIGTPLQLIELRCFRHFPAHRSKKDTNHVSECNQRMMGRVQKSPTDLLSLCGFQNAYRPSWNGYSWPSCKVKHAVFGLLNSENVFFVVTNQGFFLLNGTLFGQFHAPNSCTKETKHKYIKKAFSE